MNFSTIIIIFISIAFTLLLISLILSFKFKEKILLYFAFLCGAYIFYFISSSYLYVYLSLENCWNIYSPSIVIISLILFSCKYLNTKKYLPFMHTIFNNYIFFHILLLIISLLIESNSLNIVSGILVLITYALIIYSSFSISKKLDNNKYIKYFMWANALVFINLLFFLFSFFEYTFLIRYGLIFSLIIKILVLVFLLIKYIVEKVNIENVIKMKTMENKIFYNDLIMKEMNHRIKNNFHFIISILHLESKKNQYSNTVYLDLISRISSFSLIHEQLYLKNDQKVSISEYLSAIIDNTKKIYADYHRIKISQDIDKSIHLHYEYFLYLGVILSELITNSLKHNKNENELKILVNLLKGKNDSIIFIVRDDGEMFKKENKSNFLGLEIIKDFCNRMSNSSYDFFSENGIVFQLTFDNKEDFR